MHTIPPMGPKSPEMALYHKHLQSDHDFSVWADILTLNEQHTGSVDILDGQINFARTKEGPERTASLVLSDPEGALSFGTGYARDQENVLWVNRLVRVKHSTVVPTLGEIQATAFIGPPTVAGRNGGEITLELADKSLLADHGVRARQFRKGMNVRKALIAIIKGMTGEWNYRIPNTKKTLSKTYTCGMGEDSLTPWMLFKRIAGQEMGWRSYYSVDGYATCEATNTSHGTVLVEHVLGLPDGSTAFTEFSNYAKVTSKRKVTNKKGTQDKKDDVSFNMTYQSIAVLAKNHDLSEQSLQRHGVDRTLPLVISDNNLKSAKQTRQRVTSELKTASDLSGEQSFEIMPVGFHLDTADTLTLPMGIGKVAYDQSSTPLGTGGNQTLGRIRWVSAPVKTVRVRSKTSRKRIRDRGGRQRDND